MVLHLSHRNDRVEIAVDVEPWMRPTGCRQWSRHSGHRGHARGLIRPLSQECRGELSTLRHADHDTRAGRDRQAVDQEADRIDVTLDVPVGHHAPALRDGDAEASRSRGRTDGGGTRERDRSLRPAMQAQQQRAIGIGPSALPEQPTTLVARKCQPGESRRQSPAAPTLAVWHCHPANARRGGRAGLRARSRSRE